MSSPSPPPTPRQAPTSPPSSRPLNLHPWSPTYLRLKLFALLIRSVIGSLLPISEHLYQRLPPGGRVRVLKGSVPSREAGRRIRVHAYVPRKYEGIFTGLDFGLGRKAEARAKKQDAPASAGGEDPVPVHLNFHGSGFVIPCLGSDKEFCAEMADRLQVVVLDCDYRKAPEWPFPAGMQDAEDCLLWSLSHPAHFSPTRTSIGGFSAGANLALCTSSLHGPRLSACIAYYPPTDFAVPRGSKIAPEKHSAALPPWIARFFDLCYLVPGGVERDDPLVSPVHQGDVQRFPRNVWITAATGDTLFHDGRKMVEHLQEGGHKNAVFWEVKGEGHGFDKVAKEGSERAGKTRETFERAVEFVRESWQ